MSHDFYEHLVSNYPFLAEFDGSIFSCHHGVAKPDLRIFQILLKEYHLKAEESLFLDDMRMNVEAAESLGIHAVLFKRDAETYSKVVRLLE